MKKTIILFIALLLTGATVTAAALQHQQQGMSEKLLRLHVVANSDSSTDQRLKLNVRDAVIAVTKNLENKESAQQMLTQILTAAEECLRENGSNYPVQVTLQKEHFPTRVYDTFALPAGSYDTLRVTIGEGKGKNWWCVAFPSICLCAASEVEDSAACAGLTDSEVSLITCEEPEYILKFKILELLDQAKQHIRK